MRPMERAVQVHWGGVGSRQRHPPAVSDAPQLALCSPHPTLASARSLGLAELGIPSFQP